MRIWQYEFATELTDPPLPFQIRLNVGHPYTDVSTIWLWYLTSARIDLHASFAVLPAGRTFYLQDRDEYIKSVQLVTTGPVVDKGLYAEFPVAWIANGEALTAQTVALVVLTAGELPGAIPAELPGPLPGPPWITLDEAKVHLHITHTNSDADIQAKAGQASDIIRDYLRATHIDITWTSVTVPLPIKSAVYLLLTHLYEHRGDNMSLDDELWTAIDRLLARRRAPTVA